MGVVLYYLDRGVKPFWEMVLKLAVLRRVLNTWKRKKGVVPPFIFV
jgi:hypothetical protein